MSTTLSSFLGSTYEGTQGVQRISGSGGANGSANGTFGGSGNTGGLYGGGRSYPTNAGDV